MKNLIEFILTICLALLISTAHTQTVNWANSNPSQKHILQASFTMEDGAVFGLGYGYQLKAGMFPIILNTEFSMPAGKNFIDDFKTKIGGQVRWLDVNHFQFSTKIYGVFRRNDNEFVRLLNFGSDMSGVAGYYRSHWFIAGEFGFDKAIVTHFKHSGNYEGQYPDVANGWYEPATGGHFYYGLQAGVSMAKHELIIRAGKTIVQDLKTKPTIPLYAQLGYNFRF